MQAEFCSLDSASYSGVGWKRKYKLFSGEGVKLFGKE